MDTGDSVGSVLSTVTSGLPAVGLVTIPPSFAAKSVKAMENVTGAELSADVMSLVALQVVPSPTMAVSVTLLLSSLLSPLMVTAGCSIGSEEVKLSVTVLPAVLYYQL